MTTSAKRRPLYLWITLLAMVFSVFAPAVSHALASQQAGAGMMELCTMNGIRLVPIAAADGDSKQAPAPHGIDHCALCSSHGGSHALPARTHDAAADHGGHDDYPALFYTAPRTIHAWSASAPRGPPSFA